MVNLAQDKGLWKGLAFYFPACLPSFLLLLLILLSPISWPLGSFYEIAPELTLVVLYYFALFYRTLVPYLLLFIYGMVSDLLTMEPFGLNTLNFLILLSLTRFYANKVNKLGLGAQWGLLFFILIPPILIDQLAIFIKTGQILWQNALFTHLTSWLIFPLVRLILSWPMMKLMKQN